MEPEEAARSAVEGNRPMWGKVNRFGLVVPQKIKDLVEDCCVEHASFRADFSRIIQELQEVARTIQPAVTERPRDEDEECCSCLG